MKNQEHWTQQIIPPGIDVHYSLENLTLIRLNSTPHVHFKYDLKSEL